MEGKVGQGVKSRKMEDQVLSQCRQQGQAMSKRPTPTNSIRKYLPSLPYRLRQSCCWLVRSGGHFMEAQIRQLLSFASPYCAARHPSWKACQQPATNLSHLASPQIEQLHRSSRMGCRQLDNLSTSGCRYRQPPRTNIQKAVVSGYSSKTASGSSRSYLSRAARAQARCRRKLQPMRRVCVSRNSSPMMTKAQEQGLRSLIIFQIIILMRLVALLLLLLLQVAHSSFGLSDLDPSQLVSLMGGDWQAQLPKETLAVRDQITKLLAPAHLSQEHLMAATHSNAHHRLNRHQNLHN